MWYNAVQFQINPFLIMKARLTQAMTCVTERYVNGSTGLEVKGYNHLVKDNILLTKTIKTPCLYYLNYFFIKRRNTPHTIFIYARY